MSKGAPGNEFSHVVEVDRIGPEGLTLALTADEQARTALARRFRIPAVLSLVAKVRLMPDPAIDRQYLLKGEIEAEVEQTCVVSLEPVRQRVSEGFVRHFAPADMIAPKADLDEDEAEWLDPDAEDPVDPIEDGLIDAGAVVAEELALALDPYPRKAGAGFPEGYSPDAEEGAKVSPFAALAKLKAAKKD
ncbi:DUF177 domain-containing protein [Ferrovibrio sp.]|uniref:DUF177 domain-containing protein n=1 Tax=Ferrovibrio sp. TaxID=1917215 RepID=UPI0035B22F56